MDKYGKDGLIILSINVNKKEDPQVPDITKRYGFLSLSLRMPEQTWAERYGHKATGTVLLDRKGRGVFEPYVDSAEREQVFWNEIVGLLQQQEPL